MSYGYSEGYQYSAKGGTSDNSISANDFSRLTQVIGTNIQKISQNVASMQRMVSQLGTAQDSDSLRGQLHQLQHYTNQLAKDTNQHLKDLSTALKADANSTEFRQRRVLKERLTEEFTAALHQLQTSQRLAAQKEKDSVLRARANSGIKGNPFADESGSQHTSNLIDLASPTQQMQQQQMALQMEEEVNLDLLREREQAVRHLEAEIVDVNCIFKDLASIVHEQGDVIDSIEANVESAVHQVHEGTQQLSMARKSQNAARRKKFILLFILLIVLAVVIVIIVVSVKK